MQGLFPRSFMAPDFRTKSREYSHLVMPMSPIYGMSPKQHITLRWRAASRVVQKCLAKA